MIKQKILLLLVKLFLISKKQNNNLNNLLATCKWVLLFFLKIEFKIDFQSKIFIVIPIALVTIVQ
jgi:hypothetical protein